MHNTRIAIYTLLIFATLLLPSSNLHKKPYQDIIRPSSTGTQLKQEPQYSGGSFQLVAEPAIIPVAAPTLTPSVSVGSSNCGSDPYQILIYTRESGCDPNKWNSSGCYGLGQDCNNIVYSLCGSDWTCQNQYFTTYMQNRYGSWAAGWQHELDYGWW